MTQTVSAIDPDGLQEFSVVFTDRSLNHMSKQFQEVMRDISAMLKETYGGQAAAVIPGGGTYAMEAVARQFASNKKALVIRNGWFSFRWTQIFEAGSIPASSAVLKARRLANTHPAPFAPPPLEEVTGTILRDRPDVVFAPHVETASGIILPDDYLRSVGEAVREVGGLFVLDCIASGAIWVNMEEVSVDVVISAPQKGWSSTPAAGLVILGQRAIDLLPHTQSSSFACDLGKWYQIMQAYENGGHAYHATMPTDSLKQLRNTMAESREIGMEALRERQWEIGRRVRVMLAEHGYASVAAPGFEAPGVVVSYTDDSEIQNGSKFAALGMQIAAGVPLQCDEGDDYRSFRLGLFGLDKLEDVDGALARLETALQQL